MWKNYDYIASISNDVTINFLNIFPSLKDKIIEIPNVLPIKLINEQSVAFDVNKEMLDDGSIKLLSIGRYCEAKNFDNVPFICKKILELGLKVKWYIIGYGGDEERIKKSIKECNMEEHVILLGKKSNPYPYIKACDVYVQPSRYEGKCVSVIEAQSLHKPVIITNYPTAKSQLKDGYDGVIVPLENNECAHGIYNALTNIELLHIISENTCKSNYSNYESVNALNSLINDCSL